MNAPTSTRPDPVRLANRVKLVDALLGTVDGISNSPLHETVARSLEHLWRHGGRADAFTNGLSPDRIYLRPRFLLAPIGDPVGPVMPRLIQSKGVQLRMELLLLFDAQCRYAAGERARNVRRIASDPEGAHATWRQLVLSASAPTRGTGRGTADLRARQISEALTALEKQHLVSIPREKGGVRRQFVGLGVNSEASTAQEVTPYIVPTEGVPIPRHFFTNLWIFALTDIEIATYLTLLFLRDRFPGQHAARGVYLRVEDRANRFGIKPATWRGTNMLRRFGLVDVVPDQSRSTTGKIGDFAARWAKREVMPVHFTINDDVVTRRALEVIHQTLTAPTKADLVRLCRRQADDLTDIV